jgi:hypothetical protein
LHSNHNLSSLMKQNLVNRFQQRKPSPLIAKLFHI